MHMVTTVAFFIKDMFISWSIKVCPWCTHLCSFWYTGMCTFVVWICIPYVHKCLGCIFLYCMCTYVHLCRLWICILYVHKCLGCIFLYCMCTSVLNVYYVNLCRFWIGKPYVHICFEYLYCMWIFVYLNLCILFVYICFEFNVYFEYLYFNICLPCVLHVHSCILNSI